MLSFIVLLEIYGRKGNEVTNSERLWNRDPRWNPDLASEAIFEGLRGGTARPGNAVLEETLTSSPPASESRAADWSATKVVIARTLVR